VTALAFIGMLTAATAASEAAHPTSQTPPPADNIEILIAGPADGRAKMEEALRPLFRAADDVHWSTRERIPSEENPTGTDPEKRTQGLQIWIDVGNPAQLRIYLPAAEANGAAAVRTVARSDGDGADAELVMRETVAQIVKAAVHALRGKTELQEPPVTPAAATDDSWEAQPSAAPMAAPFVQTAPVLAATGRTLSSTPTPQRRWSFLFSFGAHTSPFKLAEPHTESNWLGTSMVGAARFHYRNFILAARLAYEESARSIDIYDLKTQYISATAAAYRSKDFGRLYVAVGVEAGALFLRQDTSADQANLSSGYANYRLLELPGQLGQLWSTGVLAGPLAEANLTIGKQMLVHLDVGMPVATLQIKDSLGTRWSASPYFRALFGVGYRL
jgi:hypothetical protein